MDRDRNMKKIVKGIKDLKPSDKQLEIIGDLSEAFKDGSEEDMFVEIIKVNKRMETQLDPDEYNEIFEKLNSIRPMLDEEQTKKLDMILKALDRE
ncbi:MAG: hypothetical protein GX329_05660 [Tissierellia bacterium]|nr:hypothetical protein [Tissierellia bacterium]